MKTWEEVHESELNDRLFCLTQLNRLKAQRRLRIERKRKEFIENLLGVVLLYSMCVGWLMLIISRL